MTEVATPDVVLPESFKAQLDEAAPPAPEPVEVKPKTRTITAMDRTWQIPYKVPAAFLYHYEANHLMHAIEGLLGKKQFGEFLDLQPSVEDDVNTFLQVVDKAYGVSGN